MSTIKTALVIMQFAIGLLPTIMGAVQAIEMPGNGPEKRSAILALVEAAFELLPDEIRATIAGNKFTVFVGKIIEIVVALLNKVGVFKK